MCKGGGEVGKGEANVGKSVRAFLLLLLLLESIFLKAETDFQHF